jgi:hypothetical protein
MAVNRKGSHIKYHFVANGKDHYYQRNYPTTLLGYCAAKGISKNHRQHLGLATDATLHQITAAVEEANTAFELHIKSITQGNLAKLTEIERVKAAKAFLASCNLKPSMLYMNPDASPMDKEVMAETDMAISEAFFSDMDEYGKEASWHYQTTKDPIKKLQYRDELQALEANKPEALQVQDVAWKLLHESPKSLPTTLLFSDAWNAYWPTKQYDGTEKRLIRAADKTKSRWQLFISHVGDQPFTQDNCNTALAKFFKHERQRPREDGKPGVISATAVRRNMVVPKAALNYLNDLEGLGFLIKAPQVKGQTKSKETYVLTQDEQRELVQYISNEEVPGYAQWKELFILIAMQTGAYASELQRAEHKLLVFDAELPYIVLYKEAKTKDRPRVVPLVFAVERIQVLANMVKDKSGLLLGASNGPERKDEGQFSSEIKKLLSPINSKATARCLRHTLAYNLDVAGERESDKALIGGWSGTTFKINPNQFLYGKQGAGNMERLRQLAEASRAAHRHLID